MSEALYRAIVGQVVPLFRNQEAPVIYRQAILPQTNMNGPVSEPSEAETLIVNQPTTNPS